MYEPYLGAKEERKRLLDKIFEIWLFLERESPKKMMLKSVAPGSLGVGNAECDK